MSFSRMTEMLILALDLGTHTGWCRGTSDLKPPPSGVVNIRPKGEPVESTVLALEGFLNDVNVRGWPDLVVYERPLPLQALKSLQRPQNEEAAVLPWRLETVVWNWCGKRDVRFEAISALTYRKHFIGKMSAGSKDQSKDRQRLETKMAMLARAQLLGYIPKYAMPTRKDATDPLYDKADACGLWDFAAATWGRRQPQELHMFGEVG
jgi:hypothetical protein